MRWLLAVILAVATAFYVVAQSAAESIAVMPLYELQADTGFSLAGWRVARLVAEALSATEGYNIIDENTVMSNVFDSDDSTSEFSTLEGNVVAGRILGVDHVIGGYVSTEAGTRRFISLRMIDVPTGGIEAVCAQYLNTPNFLDIGHEIALLVRALLEEAKRDKPCLYPLAAYWFDRAHEEVARTGTASSAMIETAIAIDLSFVWAWKELGNLYFGQGEFDKAIESFEHAIGIDTTFYLGWHNLGASYDEIEKNERAKQCFRTALRIEPGFVLSWKGLARHFLEEQQADSALACLLELTERRPELAFAWDLLGEGYLLREEYDLSAAAFKRELEIDPTNEDCWFGLLMAYSSTDDPRGLGALCDSIIALHPSVAPAWYGLACTQSLVGNADRAIAALDTAIHLDEEYREMAQYEQSFEGIRLMPEFLRMIYSVDAEGGVKRGSALSRSAGLRESMGGARFHGS